jgi:hypothetical protein
VQDQAYFEQCVRPHLDGERVKFIGAVGPERRNDVLGGARALLHLVNFDEQFGFSVVEAMACGTPVIANRRGRCRRSCEAASGYLVTSIDAAVQAVHQTDKLVPPWCAPASTRFDSGHGGRIHRRVSPDFGTHMNGLFRLGINYWPARTAMGWWQSFEREEVAADFLRIARSGFDSVRLFLTWEDFQPSAARVDPQMLERLVTTPTRQKTGWLSCPRSSWVT